MNSRATTSEPTPKMLAVDVAASLEPELQVPDALAHVQDYLHTQDPDLRLRASVERPGFFVLERRCRRAPAVNTGMPGRTDMHVQARDGYIHVSLVHAEWLYHPWNIVIALKEEGIDLWQAGAAEAIDEIEYEERWQRETRKRRRSDDSRAYYREAFDVLSRLGNRDGTERTRFQNAGIPAGLSPAPIVTGGESAAGVRP